MKLTFKYSKIYDELLAKSLKRKFKNEEVYRGEEQEVELQNNWDKEQKKIITEIEKQAGLKFKNNYVCYVVNHMKFTAISSPLTIRINHNYEGIKATLIHELVHILLDENKNKLNKKLNRNYGIFQEEVKIHIPVLLITRKVLENICGKPFFRKELEKEMHLEILDETWPLVNELYPKFNKPLIKFLR